MRDTAGPGFDARWCVDDGPVQEKVYASRAGLGWIGKNTCVINPEIGSWILLGVLVTNVDLEPDAPAVDQCGTCRLCLDACPTGAFAEPYVLDARRCLSYLTIEVRGGIPVEQRPGLGAHVFGCDICQDVCPYNAVAPAGHGCLLAAESRLRGRARSRRLWELDDRALERAIEGTALRRAGVRGLRRNLAVAIGNAGPPLTSALVRETCRRPHPRPERTRPVSGGCAAVAAGSDGGRAHRLGRARDGSHGVRVAQSLDGRTIFVCKTRLISAWVVSTLGQPRRTAHAWNHRLGR